MRYLFVHQNFPGQFKQLAPALAARGHQVVALTAASNRQSTKLTTMRYAFEPREIGFDAAGYGATYARMTDRAAAAARAAAKLRDEHGFSPDVIVGHPGWGETLFLKEVWPAARLIVFAEFYYNGRGLDTDFDPEFQSTDLAQQIMTVSRQAPMAHAMAQADAAIAPTEWQASTYPACFRERMSVIHDGVDTDALRPDPAARLVLPGGPLLRAGDEVLTFVNRNMEPYRGYHIFMRALPALLAARPEAQVVLVGRDGVSYGRAAPAGRTWKEVFLDEVRDRLDTERVHFAGALPYADLMTLLRISRAHAYLTYPFVLSWSMLEAMACGALVVGSATPPVQEVIADGVNGRLVDFFDVEEWSRVLTETLAEPERFAALRTAGRETVVARYDLKRHCLPRLIALAERQGTP